MRGVTVLVLALGLAAIAARAAEPPIQAAPLQSPVAATPSEPAPATGPPLQTTPPVQPGRDAPSPPVPGAGSQPVGAGGRPLQTTPSPPADLQTQIAPKFETFEDGTIVTLDRPDGGVDCRARGPARLGLDLRSVIFLDPAQAQDCFGPTQRRIETYAGLDSELETETVAPCAVPRIVCDALAEKLRKRKHRTVMSTDGWIDVLVVTKGDPALVPAPLRYTIVLHTDQAHLTVDLKAFKSMLGAVAEP